MNRFINTSKCLMVMLTLCSCATLLKNSTEKVTFTSNPAGAEVYLSGSRVGSTPVSLELAPQKNMTVEFRKEGFQTSSTVLKTGVGGGWVVLDVLTGLVPVIIDASTQKWISFEQTSISATLPPLAE